MHTEIQNAAALISSLAQGLEADKRDMLRDSLCTSMNVSYTDHWFPERPNKGSAFRCIQINPRCTDVVLQTALQNCDLSLHEVSMLFKSVFTIWVDPGEVSYRIGEDGSIGVYFKEPSEVIMPRHCSSKSSQISSNVQNILVNV